MTRISVILCTYNRCRSLASALESVARSKMPRSIEWEVIVVDNNSSDQTRAVVEDFSQRNRRRFRYLFEPQPGKSHALNAGIRQARGEVLAFVDDDVTVEPTWLQNLTAPLLSGEWAGSGGRILPQQAFSAPSWLPLEDRRALAVLALFDLGTEPCQLAEPPFGTNMAFQKKMFEKYGGVQTDLGPRPGCEIRGEDTEFGRRLLDAGEPMRYEPSAIVYHAVPQHRLTKAYFLAWFFDKGRAEVREFGIPSDTKWFVGGIPVYLFRRLAVWTLRWMVTFEPSQRFSCRFKVWSLAGTIVESRRHSIKSNRPKREISAPLIPDSQVERSGEPACDHASGPGQLKTCGKE